MKLLVVLPAILRRVCDMVEQSSRIGCCGVEHSYEHPLLLDFDFREYPVDKVDDPLSRRCQFHDPLVELHYPGPEFHQNRLYLGLRMRDMLFNQCHSLPPASALLLSSQRILDTGEEFID
ncbi:hypothetical protein A33O_18254 [Nitratireductor aquibiodomus RA22]|uniref:Uncharacterized protein n=1 Tax=Nitratireductor aquibiodomus RA22 TaxID=1189611 RepID=I5BSR7_9HYPH|nr:hypothetical protein A33O_18254 [Nitratireductor aquibiodomus RA22]